MIEVNLYSVPVDALDSKVGRCLARNRFDREAIGTSIEDFTRGFLKDNLDKIEARLGMGNLSSVVNSDDVLTRKDLACINYYLGKSGLKFQILNVTDDEENPVAVPEGTVEWNVINRNFIQNDYPTAIKIIPTADEDIPAILKRIVDESGLFGDKFVGMSNPFNELFDNLRRIKEVTGSINNSLISRIYDLLDQMGIEVFCATSES
jgi:hypothetical protein